MSETNARRGAEVRRVLQDLLDFHVACRAIGAVPLEPDDGPGVAKQLLQRIGLA